MTRLDCKIKHRRPLLDTAAVENGEDELRFFLDKPALLDVDREVPTDDAVSVLFLRLRDDEDRVGRVVDTRVMRHKAVLEEVVLDVGDADIIHLPLAYRPYPLYAQPIDVWQLLTWPDDVL